MAQSLPNDVETDLGQLVPLLAEFGYAPVSCLTSESFGNYRAVFSAHSNSIAITKDRGQYIVDGSQSALEPAGLWQAFSSAAALSEPLRSFLRTRQA